MKKADRLAALEIAAKYDIRVIWGWWMPPAGEPVWSVIKKGQKVRLTYDQYYYLSKNKYLALKETIKAGEEVILTISGKGTEKLKELKS